MPDYTESLLSAINNYNAHDMDSVNHLRDLVCWISDKEEYKCNPIIKSLLYIASQKMRVFGYNVLNGFSEDPNSTIKGMDSVENEAITALYRSEANKDNILDKSQKEVVELFQKLKIKRLLVSAPTSYGKTFLMREIIFLNKERYRNILLVFPTVALLLENARMMTYFVKHHNLKYKIVKTVDGIYSDGSNQIFVFTPERALQLIATYPEIGIDFFFFDEVYKIDEDYCKDEIDEYFEEVIGDTDNKRKNKNFLDEERGKTFRIALYLLSKSVSEYYLAGPNLGKDRFGTGMKRYLEINKIHVKEINFEPTLRITVNAYNKTLEEKIPQTLSQPILKKLDVVNKNDTKQMMKNVVAYIDERHYGKTLLYCTSPSKAIQYSETLLENYPNEEIYQNYPDDFKKFISHIKSEYDYKNYVEQWGLIKVLNNGFGLHHGKLPKYIQQEILEQFNKGTFNILFCTSTIVEGVNTDAQNMIVINPSKGRKKLTRFDIKNIKGRAGRYYHCFIGRVFYMNRELQKIEDSEDLALDFITYSDTPLGTIDLDNSCDEDLTPQNYFRKVERDKRTSGFLLPEEVFIKNRTISKENQEQLLQKLMQDKEYSIYRGLITHSENVESFLNYRWIKKILNTFKEAGLIDERTMKRYSGVANGYYDKGFKGILEFEIEKFEAGKHKSVDKAYAAAFESLRNILEHKIPKILSLFESIMIFVIGQKGDDPQWFSLSKVRRYYETGVKSLLGEALIEYGFPTDAIRRIEDKNYPLLRMDTKEAKMYCRQNYYSKIKPLLDPYEIDLFIKVMRTL